MPRRRHDMVQIEPDWNLAAQPVSAVNRAQLSKRAKAIECPHARLP